MVAVLRQALASDIPGIWEVRYAVTENTLAPGRIPDEEVRREIEDTGRGWVIEEGGVIQAFAIGNAEAGNVWALFVLPRAQGLGYGGRLHDAMVAWLRANGSSPLWLTTGASTKARAFYERKGWQHVCEAEAGQVRYELPAVA